MRKRTIVLAAAALAAGAAMATTTGCCAGFYSQDVGEVVVLRGMGGDVVGSSMDPGFHGTSPLNDVLTFSTRNNVLSFCSDDSERYEGGSADGPAVSCNDSGGASFSMDIQVNYSLDPGFAERMYTEYGSQENYVRNVAVVDVRSTAREVAGKFNTITILTDRGSLTGAIQDALSEKWADKGIVVEQVSVQTVRYPDSITEKYAEAQAAEVGKSKAQAEQETAKVEAETKVIRAKADADANAALAESLTDEVLRSKYYDALQTAAENGCLVVTDGSDPVVLDAARG